MAPWLKMVMSPAAARDSDRLLVCQQYAPEPPNYASYSGAYGGNYYPGDHGMHQVSKRPRSFRCRLIICLPQASKACRDWAMLQKGAGVLFVG